MEKLKFSAKHLAIDRSSAQTLIVVSVAAFIVVFSLFAAKSVLSLYKYQTRVINQTKSADNQLSSNLTAYTSLVKSYTDFNSKNPNVIGQQVSGLSTNDTQVASNDNSQIVLNALPGTNDYPALVSSLYNMVANSGTGATLGLPTQQSALAAAASNQNPQPVPLPFGISVMNSNVDSTTGLLQYLDQITRPMSVDSINIQGNQGSLSVILEVHTYFQPSKKYTISSETVN